jgi:hypothetical protein
MSSVYFLAIFAEEGKQLIDGVLNESDSEWDVRFANIFDGGIFWFVVWEIFEFFEDPSNTFLGNLSEIFRKSLGILWEIFRKSLGII